MKAIHNGIIHIERKNTDIANTFLKDNRLMRSKCEVFCMFV